jgi:CMP-N-acetylneuraminic acid synthetase
MRVLGLIPARGGSKGIPRKNIRPLAGKPLLQYTVEAAQATRRLCRLILSTDDAEIAEIGRRLGLEVPFLRPAELAADETPMLAVVQHCQKFLEERGQAYDAVCLLQPTHPLRGPETVDACIAQLDSSGADAVVTVLPVPQAFNPHWVYFQDGTGALRISTGEETPIPRRQDLPPAFCREGSVYVIRWDLPMRKDTLYGRDLRGFPVDPVRSINLDTPDDWARAEALLGP